MDVSAALRIAGELIDAGVPVFAAPPCPSGPFGGNHSFLAVKECKRPGHGGGKVDYDLPAKWQLTIPSRVWLDRWQPGWALAAVGGAAADFLDEDPRNYGDRSVGELHVSGDWPEVFGQQGTPSGGRHYIIAPLHVRKVVGFLPGLDYQGGEPTDGKGGGGAGRGFIWIAPTVRRSKDAADVDADGMGAIRPYVWQEEPNLAGLKGASADPRIRERVLAAGRARESARVEKTAAVRVERGSAARVFTPAAMEHFLAGPENALRVAQIGAIEDHANAYACALSHFVPEMLSGQAAYRRLESALAATAYDPAHPASSWEADKFVDVISDVGGRAPADWHAVADDGQGGAAGGVGPASAEAMAAAVAAVPVESDAVLALLAEMLPPSVLAERRPPRYMIKGLLTYDSETWLIGGPGSKKSFVALDMAAHVAAGQPWQGHRVNKGVALLIMGEGAGSVGKRITAWEKQYGPMPADGIRILPRPVQAGDLGAWAVLVQACARLRAALDPSLGMFIVVDTQARSTVGLDENDAQGIGVYINALAALREATGGCVMSVHHTGKIGQSTRGSSAQDGAQTSRLLMRTEKGALVSKLYSDKQKDLEEARPLELRFHKVDVGLDEDGEAVDSLVLTPRDQWASALFDGVSLDGLDESAARVVTPFSVRREPENWTHGLTHPNAVTQRWLLQALADVASERGVTQAEWRGLVEEKAGKLQHTNWRTPFQRVTESTGQAMTSGVVVKVHGADRWTVDPVVLAGLRGNTD